MKCYCQQELRLQGEYDPLQDPGLAIWFCPDYHITMAILNNKIAYYTIIYCTDLNPEQSCKLISEQDYPPSTQLFVGASLTKDYFYFGQYREVLSLPSFTPLSIKGDIIQLDALLRLWRLGAFS